MRRRTGALTIPLGRLAGVPIRAHWTWPLVTLAVAGALADIYRRGPGGDAAWPAAVGVALLLSGSLLAHELAHALVARRLGMRVHGIAIFALGGVTEIDDGESSAVRELLVALAGPLASLALAVAASAAWWLGAGPPLLAGHLALANWALALFNLLPSHPLDGGRALKATLWFLTDDELLASRAAARAAQALGLALAGFSVAFATLAGDVLNAAWLLVLGVFLWGNAMDGYRRVALQHTLRGVTTADLMRRDFSTVPPDTSLDAFVEQYVMGRLAGAAGAGHRGVPVAAAGEPPRLLGMVGLREVRRFTLSRWASVGVAEAMVPAARVRALTPELPAAEALRALHESGEDLLPVVDGEVLAGVLWRSDVVGHIQRRITK